MQNFVWALLVSIVVAVGGGQSVHADQLVGQFDKEWGANPTQSFLCSVIDDREPLRCLNPSTSKLNHSVLKGWTKIRTEDRVSPFEHNWYWEGRLVVTHKFEPTQIGWRGVSQVNAQGQSGAWSLVVTQNSKPIETLSFAFDDEGTSFRARLTGYVNHASVAPIAPAPQTSPAIPEKSTDIANAQAQANPTSSGAQKLAHETPGWPIHWRRVTLGTTAVEQAGGQIYSAVLLYSPYLEINDRWTIGINLGLAPLREKNGSLFLVTDSTFQLAYQMTEKFSVEPVAGLQTWTCDRCSSVATIGLAVAYDLDLFETGTTEIWANYLETAESLKASQYRIGVRYAW